MYDCDDCHPQALAKTCDALRAKDQDGTIYCEHMGGLLTHAMACEKCLDAAPYILSALMAGAGKHCSNLTIVKVMLTASGIIMSGIEQPPDPGLLVYLESYRDHREMAGKKDLTTAQVLATTSDPSKVREAIQNMPGVQLIDAKDVQTST